MEIESDVVISGKIRCRRKKENWLQKHYVTVATDDDLCGFNASNS